MSNLLQRAITGTIFVALIVFSIYANEFLTIGVLTLNISQEKTMLKALLDFLLNRKGHPVQKDTTIEAAAPYKVEPPTLPQPTFAPPPPGCCDGEKTEKPARKPRAKKATAPAAAMTAAPKKPRAKKAPKAE